MVTNAAAISGPLGSTIATRSDAPMPAFLSELFTSRDNFLRPSYVIHSRPGAPIAREVPG